MLRYFFFSIGNRNVSDIDLSNDDANLSNEKNERESEEVRDEFVYRVLRYNESYTDGLKPKDINSKTTLQEHVGMASKSNVKSRYISCFKTMAALKIFVSNSETRAECVVVRINITKLDQNKVKVIDLTNEVTRKKHLIDKSKACNCAVKYDEVVLEPEENVPMECVERIGRVRNRSFIKD